jgi:hypothetical protein
MTIYSQRDQRWANIFLGDNTSFPYTIGNYGCLITCLSSYIDQDPKTTNNQLKDNKAFVSGGLFVWTKSTVLDLNQTYVSPRYDGPVTDQGIAKMKDLLDQGYPLLCEVDFNPNTSGEEMHFVLILRYDGDSFYAMDPWVGEIINLSVYGGIKRAAIQFRSYDKKLMINTPSSPPDNNDEIRSLNILKEHFVTATDLNTQPFGNLEGYTNTLTQDAYRAWKNPPVPQISDSLWETIKKIFGR